MPDVDPRLAAALATRYRLLRELGRGGTATVYLAEDLRHPRQVAIKVLRPEFVLRGSVERFLREIGIAAHLQHPHILPLLDSGELDGFLYFAMPFVEGETLRDRLRREGQLGVPETLRILGDVVDAVGHAHARRVVHRDLKPENILLTGRHALVTDFGVARALSIVGDQDGLTQGVAIGTPAYMAPEQATAAPDTDHRVDIYAIGVLAYELLAGRPPFSGPTAQEILTAHVVLTPEPVTSYRGDTPAGLAAIIGRCLAKHPSMRYPDAAELLADLDPLVTPSGGLTPAGNRPVPAGSPWRRWAVIGGSAAGLAAALFFLAPRPNAQPVSGSWRQLTFRGDVVEASLAPDGQFLAYVASRDTVEELDIHDLVGGGTLNVDRADRIRRISWSGDGTEVRFLRMRDSVDETVAIPRLGGIARILPPSGSISPDGRRTAAISTSGGRLRVYDLDTGDSTIMQLDIGQRFAAGLNWSPTARYLVVRTVSPTLDDASFWVAMPSAKRVVEVLRDSTMLTEPAWSADGSALFYLRSWSGVASVWRLAISMDGTARGSPQMTSSGVPEPDFGMLTSRPSVGAGDRRFVYKTLETRSNLATLALTGPASGMGLRPLTTGTAGHPFARISEDGGRLAVIRNEGRGAVVGVMPLAGGPLQVIARMARARDLAWSPDGTALIVAGVMEGETTDGLHRFSLVGEPHRAFHEGKVAASVEWLPDGRLLYVRVGSRRIGILDPLSGADTVIAIPDTIGWLFRPRVGPGRDQVTYSWNRETGRLELWTVALSGGSPSQLSGPGWMPLRQAPNGAFFGVRVSGTSDAIEVGTLSRTGGPPLSLVGLPAGTRALDVSPDGKTLLLSLREERSDVWEVTLPPAR